MIHTKKKNKTVPIYRCSDLHRKSQGIYKTTRRTNKWIHWGLEYKTNIQNLPVFLYFSNKH